MKSAALLLFVLFIFSCKQKAQPVKLSGKYVVVGFKVKNDMQKNGGRLIAATSGIDYAFNFIDDKSLQINPKLGLPYFSDSVFKYEVTDTTLYLLGKNGQHFMPYRRNGIILNLYINKKRYRYPTACPCKTVSVSIELGWFKGIFKFIHPSFPLPQWALH